MEARTPDWRGLLAAAKEQRQESLVNLDMLDPEVRLQIVMGIFWETMAEAEQLTRTLRLRANASHATRGQLEFLGGMIGAIWETLNRIETEVRDIHAALGVKRDIARQPRVRIEE
jgi:hypothetical protein